jgi:chromosome segregation ATPase
MSWSIRALKGRIKSLELEEDRVRTDIDSLEVELDEIRMDLADCRNELESYEESQAEAKGPSRCQ